MTRKNLTQIAIGILATVVLTGSVVAQTSVAQNHAGRQAGHHGQKLQQALDKLNLTPKQRTEIKAIVTQAREQSKAVRANDNQTVGELKTKMKQIHEETRTRIQAVLTPEQREKLAQMKKNHQKGHKAGATKRGGETKKNIPPA